MKIEIEAGTDVGRVRELNEDSYRVIQERNAVVVCDGMGGHAAGEIASATAAETITELLLHEPEELNAPVQSAIPGSVPTQAGALAGAVRVANRRLYIEASRSNKLRGMGTTVVAAVFTEGTVITAHVGDSRAYRITADGIEQLTVDHSWVAELVQSGQVRQEDAERFADKNVITRALGTRPSVQVDVGVFPANSGEIFLLCSDGLCGFVSDDEMFAIVSGNRDNLATAAKSLIDAANAAGGLDNSTVALVRIEETGSPAVAESATATLPEEDENELGVMDQLIASRFPQGASMPVAEEATDRSIETPVQEVAESARPAGGARWAWLVLVVVAAALAVIMWWPREQPGTGDPDASPQAATDPGIGPVDGVVYLQAGAGWANHDVYWNGIRQGRLSEIAMGLLVEPGDHELVILSGVDTVWRQIVTVRARDTLRIPLE